MAKYLKLLMVALFATMTFALTSCSDDDDEPSDDKSTAGNVVGTWKMVDGLADAAEGEQYYQFRENGTCYEVLVLNDEWAELFGSKYDIEDGTWSLSGNQLKISFKNTVTIKKISSKEMIIVEMGIEGKLNRVSDDIVNNILNKEGY